MKKKGSHPDAVPESLSLCQCSFPVLASYLIPQRTLIDPFGVFSFTF